MRKKAFQYAWLIFLALAISAASWAQETSAAPDRGTAGPHRLMARIRPGRFAFDRIVGGFGGKVVTNAPFSAQVTRTTHQALTDGGRINRTETGSIARDSVGRMRREMTLPEIGPLSASGTVPHIVFIRDPAAGKGYILNENRKTVLTISLANRPNAEAQTMRMKTNTQPEVNLQKQSLGSKAVNGLTLEGTLYTRTIPAGRIGNDKPIVITTEEWYSPQLQMAVSRTRNDPRFGTTSYQLTSIQLDEPPQSLFVVPSDYAPAPARMMLQQKMHSPGRQLPPPPNGD